MEIDSLTIQKLKEANKICFFTGAGISAESGISTFRGAGGIWNKLSPAELASFDAFLRNTELVWEWYRYRRKIVEESKPNKGHIAIAEFQKYYDDVAVVTQNIDNLHRRAGSRKVYELHGNIERNYCIKCHKFYNHDFPGDVKVPKCECGGLIRPDIVWFGEFLPDDEFTASEEAVKNCDIFISAGTSAVVYPAASLIYLAKQHGAYMIEVNVESTEASRIMDRVYIGESGTILPQLLEATGKPDLS